MVLKPLISIVCDPGDCVFILLSSNTQYQTILLVCDYGKTWFIFKLIFLTYFVPGN